MADNIQYSGSGATVPTNTIQRTDDLGAAGHVPYIKILDGTDGGTEAIAGDASNGLDVDVTRLPALPAGTNNIGDVDVATVPAPLSTTGGGTEATALRVTVANDSTGVLSVDDNGGSLTVDGPLTDAQLRASAVPVSLASSPLPTGAATLAEQQTQTTALQLLDDTVYTDGTGTPSKAIGIAGTDGTNPQIIKTDSAGELQVDVLTSALPTGAATAANQSTSNTALAAIQAAVEIIDNAISGSEIQADVLTLPALPAGTNNIGDVDVLTLPAIPTGDNSIGRVKLTDGTDVADVLDLTNSNPLTVAIVDGAGSQITSFGGGTQYTEGDTDASITGTAMLWEDTSDTLRSVSAAKPLPVNVVSGSAAGTEYTEDAAAAANPQGGALIIVRDDARGGSLTTTDGDNVAARGTNAGELYVKHVDSIAVTNAGLTELAGAIDTEVQVDIVGSLPAGANNIGDVDVLSSALPTGASTLAEQQSQTTHLATIAGDTTAIQTATELIDDAIVADDAAFTPATTKVMMAGFEFDDTTPDLVNEGDAGAARMSANRNVYTQVRDAAGNERGANVSAGNALLVDGSATTQPVSGTVTANAGTNLNTSLLALESGGNLAAAAASLSVLDDWDESDRCKVNAAGSIADDSTTPNNPVMIGGTAKETDGTDPGSVSTEDDVARVITDRNRRLLVNDAHPNMWSLFEDHTSAQTNNQLKAAPGANLSLYITDIVFSNGATAGSIKLVEDEGGTPAQITQTVYMAINGGAVMNFRTPKRLTANKSLGFTSTTVTTHSVEVHGYIAP